MWTRNRHCISTRRWLLALPTVLLGLSALAGGPPEDINQISGHLRFTNENLAIIDAFEFYATAGVYVRSQGETPFERPFEGPLFAYQLDYAIEVAATPTGLVYDVYGFLDALSGARYVFRGAESPPVVAPPTPGVTVEIAECAGRIDVRWVDANGEQASSGYGLLTAYPADPQGGFSNSYQAQASGNTLAVRGDGTEFRIDMLFVDLVQQANQLCFETVQVHCDEIIELTCQLDDPGEPWWITGVVDMIAKEELSLSGHGTIVDSHGPLRTFAFQQLEDPASGLFQLAGVVGSSATSPPTPQSVTASMAFTSGNSLEWFNTPMESVFVDSGESVDLGSALVLRPGYLTGRIDLTGPPNSGNGSCLAALQLFDPGDEDGDGVPDGFYSPYSRLSVYGHNVPAPSATRSARGGGASVGLVGNYEASTLTYSGDYELALAGLYGEPANWLSGQLRLSFYRDSDPAAPRTAQASALYIYERPPSVHLIEPRKTVTEDLDYCLGELSLELRSPEGAYPVALADGNLDPDYYVSPNYRASAGASGHPACAPGAECPEDLQDKYYVGMCIPEGSYTIDTRFDDFSSGISLYGMPLTVRVGCRQVLRLSEDLGVELAPLGECTSGSNVGFSGSVYSTEEVQRISYTLNGGPEIDLCLDCGEDPPFQSQLSGTGCNNLLEVVATDAYGNESSAAVAFDCLVPIDNDLDGTADCSDCAPADANLWGLPGEVAGLRLDRVQGGGTRLDWDDLEQPGSVSPTYHVVTRDDSSCFDSDVGAEPSAIDDVALAAGSVRYFVVGARNRCGVGPLGEDSNGILRPACR